LIYNSKKESNDMQKNPDKNFVTVEVDPATDDYYVTIPEWIINDLGWYEGTEVEWVIDGDELILKEVVND
jgi:bifunctional DNA-binding transcriptional regulator/antitoxin component of YhaV-PrlF toxin-antitoxin module